MADTLKLKTFEDNGKDSVKEFLTKTIDENYEHVMIIGVKDGQTFSSYSGYYEIAKTLGYLELLKHDIIRDS